METPTAPQSLSAERREEVQALWSQIAGIWGTRSSCILTYESELMCFAAAIDAQHAERTRAEVEKMREAAAKVADEHSFSPLAFNDSIAKAIAAAIRALPIEPKSKP